MRVDDGRDGIRRVAEAVDELEAEGDQQRDEEQQIGQKRRGSCAVGIEAVRHIQQTAGEQQKEDDSGARVERPIEFGACCDRPGPGAYLQRSVGQDYWSSPARPSASPMVRNDGQKGMGRRFLNADKPISQNAAVGRQQRAPCSNVFTIPDIAQRPALRVRSVVSAFAPVDRLGFGHPALRSGRLQDAERYHGSAHVLPTPRCRGNTLAHAGPCSAGSFGARRGRGNTASPIQCSSIPASVDIGPRRPNLGTLFKVRDAKR